MCGDTMAFVADKEGLMLQIRSSGGTVESLCLHYLVRVARHLESLDEETLLELFHQRDILLQVVAHLSHFHECLNQGALLAGAE